MEVMIVYMSIGDFSRATHLTVKTLRHYHHIGLRAPADVDPHSGYRRYSTEQPGVARVVRRFRDLDMPLEEIQALLATTDPAARNERIVLHLDRPQQTPNPNLSWISTATDASRASGSPCLLAARCGGSAVASG